MTVAENQAKNRTETRVQVLIVGGGPVGLGMAIDLGKRGVSTALADLTDGTVEHPRTGLVAIRTMEMARGWGLADRIRNAGFPDDYDLSMVFCTSLNGLLIDREPYPSMRDTPTPPETPEKKQRCPQFWMQPILAEAARSEPLNDIRFNHRFDDFTQDADGVTSTVRNLLTGETMTFRSEYLLACDGAASSVRESLGIAMTGRHLSFSVNVLITAPGLVDKHKMGPAERYLFVGPEGTWGNLTVVDGKDIWRLTVLGNEEKMDLATFDPHYWVKRALGSDDIAYQIDSVIPWRRAEMLADRFTQGRVILAGDAVHTTSPTGGMGMNTGMQEVMDLGWKLEALVKGWGGPALLDSYEFERRPVAARNLSFSTGNFRAWQEVPETSAIDELTEEGARQRRIVGETMRESTKVEWESTGLQIGHRYQGSPICIPDGSPETPDDFSIYVPTARPGSRAPHAWLSDGRSTLDLFGRSFVLLAFRPGGDTAALQLSFAERGVPLAVEVIDNPSIAALYERAFVLVRPDGHVAWRGDEIVGCETIADTVRGALPHKAVQAIAV